MPLAYSASQQEDYSRYPIGFLYPAARLAYQEDDDLSEPFIDIQGCLIRPKGALTEIKKRMRKSPEMYLWTVKAYLRSNFNKHHFKYSSHALSTIILRFLVKRYDYEKNKEELLSWAAHDSEWGFITEWLEDEMRFRHLYTGNNFLNIHINSLKKFYGCIYIYKNNFLKKELLSWLIKEHGWRVSTNKEISSLGNKRYLKSYKEIVYKMKMPQLLQDDKRFFYSLLCLHLLNKQRIDGKQSSTATMAQLDHSACQSFWIFSIVRLCSTIYWQYIDEFFIETTGSLALDIFCAPLLLAFTVRGLLGLYLCWFVYVGFLKS